VRWWLNTDHKAFAVDNSSVSGGMDFSALPADVWMVQWIDGRGEIEHQTADGENLNGLRESFIDVIPYAPYFKQFLSLLPGLTLDQAKKIQIELINTIFDSKRQMPFHYVVATGDFWWDASDTSMAAAALPAIQNATISVDNVIVQLNATITAFNNLVAQINSYIVDGVNADMGYINSAFASINTALGQVDSQVNSQVNSYIVDVSAQIVTHVNDVVLSVYDGVLGVPNSVNYGLHSPGGAAPSGISADIAHIPYAMSHIAISVGTNPFGVNAIPYVGPGAAGGIVGPVPTTNVQWIPIGATAAVDVTTDEQQAILAGISERTNELNLIRNQKNAAVNALTTIASVIAYDVTTGWPAYTPPPGFQLWQTMSAAEIGSSMVFVGSGGTAGGGVPEAPSDNVTYGRRNQAWNPALAKSGDVLDGGSF
jgi:hypothetical protein